VALGGGLLLGAAGTQFGPVWTEAGAVTGVILAPVVYLVLLTLRLPDPEKLLAAGRPREALKQITGVLAMDRRLAARWPSRFRDVLAGRLLTKAEILHVLHKEPQALEAVEEAVAILTEIAGAGPSRQDVNLARGRCLQAALLALMGRHGEALAAADDAVALYRDLTIADRNHYAGLLAEALERQADALGYLDRLAPARAAAAEATLIRSDMMPGLPPAARLSDGVQP
jgi:tetratricopeptide (TPR) repeat protein